MKKSLWCGRGNTWMARRWFFKAFLSPLTILSLTQTVFTLLQSVIQFCSKSILTLTPVIPLTLNPVTTLTPVTPATPATPATPLTLTPVTPLTLDSCNSYR
ncbi:hypothetical protein ElyMa_006485300 [Elysia marginata]|uniref:Uncharacterized protein n=1 Tax=Elysia marginata TaxID=1093978 RepID=A0AAV4I2D0_9GAST|nr:hypothetical protein ElyMa_006485300 [Elysia marginata]